MKLSTQNVATEREIYRFANFRCDRTPNADEERVPSGSKVAGANVDIAGVPKPLRGGEIAPVWC